MKDEEQPALFGLAGYAAFTCSKNSIDMAVDERQGMHCVPCTATASEFFIVPKAEVAGTSQPRHRG